MQELFPHERVREHQDRLLEDVKETVEEGGSLVAHAPTGLGKTAAVVPPSLSHALENGRTVFFLTPRHSQHRIAVETLKTIKQKHGKEFTGVDLIGKKWFCNQDGVEDLSGRDFRNFCKTLREEERCQYYNRTYDKDTLEPTDQAREKVSELKGEAIHAENVQDEVRELCPYYVQMMMAAEAEVMIADYFHLFHEGVRKSLFSRMGRSLEDAIVIVDEAHNLPSRVRSLKSSRLSMPQIDRALKEVKKFGFYDAEENLERLQRELERLGKKELGSEREVHVEKDELRDRVENFADYEELIVDLESVADEVREERDKSYCGGISEFLEDWNGPSNGYARILRRKTSRSGNRYLQLEYSCLDPQVTSKEVLNDSHASILMSGTLTPVDMYTDLLGLVKDRTRENTYESPFPDENKRNLVVDKVTTKYKERGESEFQKIAWYISKSAEHVPGNVGVFFPSYDLRDDIAEHLDMDRETFREERDMNKQDKQEMLAELVDVKEEGGAMLGVIGGSFGEGVDYPGKLMNAVFVVGLPLERPDLETKALIDFYDYRFDRGWDYGYAYPAMNRAMQAAGRAIRSKDDEGVVVYMDERYTWGNYRKVFPPEEDFTVT
ncbi:MAG: ATP-dependent DNA helicase, partial [Candidatus Nanohaloarchaea archaeon]|nr:ATP-dependent DNA helicase [Candidatus Nanohaloarchaea archaeon]